MAHELAAQVMLAHHLTELGLVVVAVVDAYAATVRLYRRSEDVGLDQVLEPEELRVRGGDFHHLEPVAQRLTVETRRRGRGADDGRVRVRVENVLLVTVAHREVTFV